MLVGALRQDAIPPTRRTSWRMVPEDYRIDGNTVEQLIDAYRSSSSSRLARQASIFRVVQSAMNRQVRDDFVDYFAGVDRRRGEWAAANGCCASTNCSRLARSSLLIERSLVY